jgi:hypothetical protein
MAFARISVTVVLLGTIALLAANCGLEERLTPTCADNADLCPKSTRTATMMACDCKCTIGMFGKGRSWRGALAVCLPPQLNARLASPEQLRALETMTQRTFDQDVYRYCSSMVADFLRLGIKARGTYPIDCATPVDCECSTKGALYDSRQCRTPCADVACTSDTCLGIIRKDETIDMSACVCNRASACGGDAPEPEAPPLCRDLSGVPL